MLLTNSIQEQLKLIDPARRVKVYKNLHKNCFSVMQGGRVKFHTNFTTLADCRFLVQPAGRAKVREEKKKNVHAFVSGYIRVIDRFLDVAIQIQYNPYIHDEFVYNNTRIPAPNGKNVELLNGKVYL